MSDRLKDIRITDDYIKSLVEAERRRRGDATCTLTAGRMLIERDMQLQAQRMQQPSRRQKQPA